MHNLSHCHEFSFGGIILFAQFSNLYLFSNEKWRKNWVDSLYTLSFLSFYLCPFSPNASARRPFHSECIPIDLSIKFGFVFSLKVIIKIQKEKNNNQLKPFNITFSMRKNFSFLRYPVGSRVNDVHMYVGNLSNGTQ